MSTVLKISSSHNKATIEKNLKRLAKKKKRPSDLSKFYGALPTTFGDGLAFQEKVRHEWE